MSRFVAPRSTATLAGLIAALGGCLACDRPEPTGADRESSSVSRVTAAPSTPPDELPNIVILVLDTVRCDFTSLCTNGPDTTPNLLALAKRGVLFDRAYSTTDSTPTSHFSLFTGLVSGFLGTGDHPAISIAHHLGKVGYDTVGVSANFNVRKESMRSVRPFRVFLSPARAHLSLLPEAMQTSTRKAADDLIDRFDAPHTDFNRNLNLSSASTVNALLDTLLTTTSKPALVFVNFIDAHDPYFPASRFHDLSAEDPLEGFFSDLRTRTLPSWMQDPGEIDSDEERGIFEHRLQSVQHRAWSLADDLPEAALDRYRRRYRAEIKALDAALADTLEVLKRHGFFENSLLVITSDHGEAFGERGYLTHSMRNEGDKESTRHVPLLIVPSFEFADSPNRVAEVVSLSDVTPTIYDLLGIDDAALRSKYGKRYGTSLRRRLGTLPTWNSGAYAIPESPGPMPQNDATEEELEKSLRALGYIE